MKKSTAKNEGKKLLLQLVGLIRKTGKGDLGLSKNREMILGILFGVKQF